MSKLFSRAKTRLQTAKYSWKMRREDDSYVDAACFDLQQCMEFCLKTLVELNNESYVQNHDLRAQLNKLAKIGVNFPVFEKIAQNASTFNSWETESRYKDSFVALSQDVELAFQICEELIQNVDELITKENLPKINLFEDKED